MNPLWLILIIPVSASIGLFVACLLFAGRYAESLTVTHVGPVWINASEQMPDTDDANEDGEVLCHLTDGAIETYKWYCIVNWNIEHDVQITHWMPVPEFNEVSE